MVNFLEVTMKRFKLLLGCTALPMLALGVSTALAAPPGQNACSGGTLAPGVYDGLTVTGTCTVMGDVTINGNVTVKPGGYLDAAYLETKLIINGNVHVGKNAKLGLGCSFGYHDCLFDPSAWEGNVVVNGNVVANQRSRCSSTSRRFTAT
jgi:hypothetical protein